MRCINQYRLAAALVSRNVVTHVHGCGIACSRPKWGTVENGENGGKRYNERETDMSEQPVLIAGEWRSANKSTVFTAANPRTCDPLPDEYPVSTYADCDAALDAAVEAAEVMRGYTPERVAAFLERYAERIEARADEIVAMAHEETALGVSPRLANIELPRTTNQLRQAAAAASEGSWVEATIDTRTNIRSYLAPIGPVCVFGPNNFPLAFGSVSGGDFAAAIAAGNPVIGKANSSHPGTTRLLAEEARHAIKETGMPPALVQLIYRTSHEDGEKLVADPQLGATGYTGSRSAGLKLKAAADAVGKPIYLELSSVNPVVILPGALEERADEIAKEFVGSCLMGAGQFCTNPGLVVLVAGAASDAFIAQVVDGFQAAPVGTLLGKGVQDALGHGIDALLAAGAKVLTTNGADHGVGFCHANTLLKVSGDAFLADSIALQTETFGNCSLIVVADKIEQVGRILDATEGNLTGCFYTDTEGSDDDAYHDLAPRLRRRVGRLLNDKMPTGVAVSPAMNHGGPFPATGHPGFTAVGIPASLRRFAMLQCFDDVRSHRLPRPLWDQPPHVRMWRRIDGQWRQGDVTKGSDS
jgi:alpha-ketoglutaric semialdehyde dehydrogenase